MATGHIRRYVIWITTVGCLVFPLTWVAFELGAPSESTYVIFILVYMAVEIVRLWLMKEQLNFPVLRFAKEVLVKIVMVSVLAATMPVVFVNCVDSSMLRTISSIALCFICTVASIYLFGLTAGERKQIVGIARTKLHI